MKFWVIFILGTLLLLLVLIAATEGDNSRKVSCEAAEGEFVQVVGEDLCVKPGTIIKPKEHP